MTRLSRGARPADETPTLTAPALGCAGSSGRLLPAWLPARDAADATSRQEPSYAYSTRSVLGDALRAEGEVCVAAAEERARFSNSARPGQKSDDEGLTKQRTPNHKTFRLATVSEASLLRRCATAALGREFTRSREKNRH